jgi:anti-anti-sigma factor
VAVPREIFKAVPLDDRRGLRLVGELDLATVVELDAMFEALPGEGPVTLDLAELAFIDASGLHAFERYAQTLNGSRPLILENVPAYVRRLFEVTGRDQTPSIELRISDERG